MRAFVVHPYPVGSDRKMFGYQAFVEDGSSMAPESESSRLARLEAQREQDATQIRMLAPLGGTVPTIMLRLETISDNLARHEREGRERAERIEREAREDRERDMAIQRETLERLTRSFESQFITVSDRITNCGEKVGEVAKALEAWQESERQRRERERKEREERERREREAAETGKVQKFVARYGLITGLTVVLISSLTSIIIAFFGGG